MSICRHNFFLFPDIQSKKCYDQALAELADPLLPTRGHGLRQLSKLLKARNKFAVRDEEKLFGIFESYLKHDDTYLYLAAVDALTSLVDVHHRTIVPLLCRKFIEMRTDGNVSIVFCFVLRLLSYCGGFI